MSTMQTMTVTLDPGATLAPLFTVPVRDEGWNGFPAPLLTADECLTLSAWIAAEGGTTRLEVRTGGAVWWVDVDDEYAHPVPEVDVDGVRRFDMAGMTWDVAAVYTDAPTAAEWAEQRDYGAVRFGSRRAMWVDREAWHLASRNATREVRHPRPDEADYARAAALVPALADDAPDA